jgi:hypothetical protein
MKYLNKFKNLFGKKFAKDLKNGNLYNRISYSDYVNKFHESLIFTHSEIEKISTFDVGDIKLEVREDNYSVCIYKNRIKHLFTKGHDDWFYLSCNMPNELVCYKCDTIDGVLNAITDIINGELYLV